MTSNPKRLFIFLSGLMENPPIVENDIDIVPAIIEIFKLVRLKSVELRVSFIDNEKSVKIYSKRQRENIEASVCPLDEGLYECSCSKEGLMDTFKFTLGKSKPFIIGSSCIGKYTRDYDDVISSSKDYKKKKSFKKLEKFIKKHKKNVEVKIDRFILEELERARINRENRMREYWEERDKRIEEEKRIQTEERLNLVKNRKDFIIIDDLGRVRVKCHYDDRDHIKKFKGRWEPRTTTDVGYWYFKSIEIALKAPNNLW